MRVGAMGGDQAGARQGADSAVVGAVVGDRKPLMKGEDFGHLRPRSRTEAARAARTHTRPTEFQCIAVD